MTKVERVRRRVDEVFRDKLGAAFREKFGSQIETSFDFFGSMRLVSRRVDGKKLTKEQFVWIGTFSDGYADAMEQITERKS